MCYNILLEISFRIYGGILILIAGINYMVKSSKYTIGKEGDSKAMIIFQVTI